MGFIAAIDQCLRDIESRVNRTAVVRHSESSFPMTTYEIREAVLISASAEALARTALERWLNEARSTTNPHCHNVARNAEQ